MWSHFTIGFRQKDPKEIITLSFITAQKIKFSIKDFFSKCDQIHSFLRIWSYLLKKSLMVNFIFCAVYNMLNTRPCQTSLHKKNKFSIKDFFSKCDQIHRKSRIYSHLLKKSLMENFIFSTVHHKVHSIQTLSLKNYAINEIQ